MKKAKENNTADINLIMKLLPHRYPFLMIDKIIDINSDESAIGIKNVSYNEIYFPGHFPGNPILPGVLIIEAIAQTAGAIVTNSLNMTDNNKTVYFMSIDQAKFRKPVIPGDIMNIHISKIHNRKNVWKYHGNVRVNETIAACAIISAMIINKTKA